jgi:hypothetical protein
MDIDIQSVDTIQCSYLRIQYCEYCMMIWLISDICFVHTYTTIILVGPLLLVDPLIIAIDERQAVYDDFV